MGKSFDNTIDILLPPPEMYGKVMSMSDDMLPLYYAVLTDVPEPELAEVRQALITGSSNPRDIKMRLARDIVTQFHSAADATTAEADFQRRFQRREMPEDIPEHRLDTATSIIDLLVATGLTTSKGEARRLIDGGGVRVNGEKVVGYESSFEPGNEAVVQVGRRKFVRIT
jgi:tyrosyl-tRNA synthetase